MLLQKPHSKSKSKDHVICLERRLKSWKEGQIDLLLDECRTIQQHIPSLWNLPEQEIQMSRAFAKLMFEGKVTAATKLLNNMNVGQRLHLDTTINVNGNSKTVRDVLIEKHPKAQVLDPTTILDVSPPSLPHPVLYEQINGSLIHSIALKMNGAAGPSGLDAAAWKRLLSSFKNHSRDLCDAISSMTRRLCTEYVDPSALSAFTACRLIALDKNPGVCPIGIGEVLRQIVNKAIVRVTKDDVTQVTGGLQLCTGQQSGCEAAIHTMNKMFSESDDDAVILVDASNAFNQLNRKAALFNITRLCPAIAPAIVNTY